MSCRPLEPFRLACIFVPDGSNASQFAGAFGRHTLTLPAIFLADDYDGPRPGYPWIEFGRMTFATKPRMAHRRAPRRMPGEFDFVTRNDVQSGDAAEHSPAAPQALYTRGVGQGVVENGTGWYSFPDLSATVTALKAASASNPVVASLARQLSTKLADAPIQQEQLPPPPSRPPQLPETISDTDLGPEELLPWRQPGFAPGTNDRIFIPPDTDPPGPIDPTMWKLPPPDNVPAQRPFRQASTTPRTIADG